MVPNHFFLKVLFLLQVNKVKNMKPLDVFQSFLVEEATVDDDSVVGISPQKMEELGVFNGDTVLLRGKKRKVTLTVVQRDDEIEAFKLRMTKVTRSNLRCIIFYSFTVVKMNCDVSICAL